MWKFDVNAIQSVSPSIVVTSKFIFFANCAGAALGPRCAAPESRRKEEKKRRYVYFSQHFT